MDYKELHYYFNFGLPVSDNAWQEMKLSELFTSSGPSITRTILFNQISKQVKETYPELKNKNITAGTLLTATTITNILRYICHTFCFEQAPFALVRATENTSKNHQTIKERMVTDFPPQAVRNGETSTDHFLSESFENKSHAELTDCELILLNLLNINPAFKLFKSFFNDQPFEEKTKYSEYIADLEKHFAREPKVARLDLPLFECLKAPMKASPDSLEGQLAFIKEHWALILPADLLEELLFALDIVREETFLRGIGPGPREALRFDQFKTDAENEYEPAMFSVDADWMSNVVLMAKTVHVWLYQLSQQYQQHIKYLSDIPDEELDRLRDYGFTGLWLIGLWERSHASQKIKQMMGNPEAAPSAYSLYDYEIAEELGGYQAYKNLFDRAMSRGIRLASDMVPNHTGIYSKWVREHPDWFVQLPYPPYPNYSFNCENLSDDPSITLQIEDGYWNHSDAAVVFKRIDNNSGETRYIYHGNDGTSTPWNDTAQLNFMLPQVREAVVQTILHVARMFPIIRFDAAMTLAKKHFQRLWFPKGGDAGGVPSRAEYGMSKEQFDQVFPKEFWREVVDRVKAEVPDTLLLAEAFWLMEGYFVRTLGMHRVYNSAFMNMLKMEDNGKYRQTIKNVLEFSPEVLKRFVNFMNNPDEDTAVAQFGKGDKYIGTAIMMTTMPGLPMFGHGQVEGLTEKYGMEYRRAYWDEQPDNDLINRHKQEVFPLMRQRELFSSAGNFALFDFVTGHGHVDENVYAYSNKFNDRRALMLYNNAYNNTEGRLHTSTAINIGGDDNQHLIRKNLCEALELASDNNDFYIATDHRTKEQYLLNPSKIISEGLPLKLYGYGYIALINFEQVYDHDGIWGRIFNEQNGSPHPDLRRRFKEIKYQALLEKFEKLFDSESSKPEKDFELFIEEYSKFEKSETVQKVIIEEFKEELENLSDFDKLILKQKKNQPELYSVFERMKLECRSFILYKIMKKYLRRLDEYLIGQRFKDKVGYQAYLLFGFLSKETLEIVSAEELPHILIELLDHIEVQQYIDVNSHENSLWFSKERYENFLILLFAQIKFGKIETAEVFELLAEQFKLVIKSEYRFTGMLKLIVPDQPDNPKQSL